MIKVMNHGFLNKLHDVYLSVFPDQNLTKDQVSDLLKDPHNVCYGFFENYECVAFLICQNVKDYAEIVDMGVIPEFRRNNIATKMIEDFRNEQTQILKIILEVRESNESAIRFYEKMNFKQISKRKKYYQDGEDALVMEWVR